MFFPYAARLNQLFSIGSSSTAIRCSQPRRLRSAASTSSTSLHECGARLDDFSSTSLTPAYSNRKHSCLLPNLKSANAASTHPTKLGLRQITVAADSAFMAHQGPACRIPLVNTLSSPATSRPAATRSEEHTS